MAKIQSRPTRAARDSLGDAPKASVEDRLLAAMERLLETGQRFAAVSVEQLCREAGIARATFYLHFRDKGELVARLMSQVTEEIIVSAGTWLRQAEDAERQDVQQALEGMVCCFREHHATLAAVIDTAPQDENVATLYRDMLERIQAQSQQALDAISEKGLNRPGTDADVVNDLSGMLVLYLIRSVGERDADGLDRLARSLGHIAASVAFAD